MLQCSAMNVNTEVMTVSVSSPYDFGKWMGASSMAANAAMWYADTADMIDYLIGYAETHAQDAQHKAASMLLDQLTQPQDDCQSFEEWRFGL